MYKATPSRVNDGHATFQLISCFRTFFESIAIQKLKNTVQKSSVISHFLFFICMSESSQKWIKQRKSSLVFLITVFERLKCNRRLWNARWQQTYQVNFHFTHMTHMTENNGFYLVSLLPPRVPKVSHW